MSEIWSKEEEIRRLQERFNALRIAKISQASFARDFQMPGGASMITQHLKATRPISMEHALVYARGFKCQLSEISPRLARLVADGQATVNGRFISVSQVQFTERRESIRVDSVESAVEEISHHLNSVAGYDKPTVISLLTTLANSPDMHSIVAAGLKALKPKARDDPEKRSSPAQETSRPKAA